MLEKQQVAFAGHVCFVMGFLSIGASIATWSLSRRGESPEASAHAERYGIFVGLWAPTFFALSDRLDRYAKALPGDDAAQARGIEETA